VHPLLADRVALDLLFLVLGVVVAALVGFGGLLRSGVPAREALRLQAMLALAGLLGAKLYSFIERGGMILPVASELTQGFRYPGALLAIILFLPLLARRWCRRARFATLGDALAPSVGFGAALVRLGCLYKGCCFGVTTRVPWAVQFAPHSPAWNAHVAAGLIGVEADASLPVHPLQLYFIVLSLAAALFALWLRSRKAYQGEVALAFLASDGLGKWALETLRHESLPAVQMASLVIAIGAVTLLTLIPIVAEPTPKALAIRGLGGAPSRSRPKALVTPKRPPLRSRPTPDRAE